MDAIAAAVIATVRRPLFILQKRKSGRRAAEVQVEGQGVSTLFRFFPGRESRRPFQVFAVAVCPNQSIGAHLEKMGTVSEPEFSDGAFETFQVL